MHRFSTFPTSIGVGFLRGCGLSFVRIILLKFFPLESLDMTSSTIFIVEVLGYVPQSEVE